MTIQFSKQLKSRSAADLRSVWIPGSTGTSWSKEPQKSSLSQPPPQHYCHRDHTHPLQTTMQKTYTWLKTAVKLMIEEVVLIRPITFFWSHPYLLQDRGKDGSGITVLGGVLAIEPAQLLQARQLQGVQVRGVVLSQMSVSLQLQERQKRKAPESNPINYPNFQAENK